MSHNPHDPLPMSLMLVGGAAGYARTASALKVRNEVTPPARAMSLDSSPSHRDASFWAVKTPGVIFDEMRAAKSDMEALGRDISATFRRPFESQLASATQQFVQTYGRRPGVGRAARDDDDQVVRSLMQPNPTDADWEHKSYQGSFVHQWSEFEREFGDFWAEHAHSWTDRMWRGTYDQAVEFRRRTLAWRQSFVAFGGQPTSPAPKPPVEEILPGISFSWKTVALVGGLAAGALFVVPAALRAAAKPR